MNSKLFAAMATLLLAAPLTAQTSMATPTTAILTRLTVKPEIDRPQLMKVMPEEIRETVKLYLNGKIQQWYSQSDGQGVVFILNCGSVAEAKALMDGLPLAKANFANFEFTALGPLGPLRLLVAEPPKANPQQ